MGTTLPPVRFLTNRLIPLALVGLVPVIAAACGGSSSSGDLTLDDWRAQADTICVAARQQADASQPVTGAGNPAVPVRARAALVQTQADEITKLGDPDGEAETAEALVEALERQSDALDQLADALLADPTATSGVVGAAVTVETDKVTAAATTLDLASCTTQASAADTGTEPGTVDPKDEGFGSGGQTQEG